MKQIITLTAVLIVLTLVGAGKLAAQSQMGSQMPIMGQSGQQDQPAGQPPMMGGGMMGMPMMGMTCPMMSGGMGMMSMMPHMMGRQMRPSGMGMGGMMGGGQMDPKTMGLMLQLRGEILKAIGEVMLKHGKAIEESK